MTKDQFTKLPEDVQATVFAEFMKEIGGGNMVNAMKMMFHASNCSNCASHLHAAFDAFITKECEVIATPDALVETVMTMVDSALQKTSTKNIN